MSQEKSTIAHNRKATHEYFIEQRLEAGLVLQGWEIKSIREGRAQLSESYIFVKRGEIWLFGANITPLLSASTHIKADPVRTRKLLLNRQEIDKLTGYTERQGYTLIPLSLYFKKGKVKCEVGLAKGKKQHDKRAAMKDREWAREKQRVMKRA
jgi:SsrA-binding protein